GASYQQIVQGAPLLEGGATAAEIIAGLQAVMSGDEPSFYAEYGLQAGEESRWFGLRITRCDVNARRMGIVANEAITKRHIPYDKLRHAAFHDELTDLPNRKMLLQQLGRCLARAHRKSGFQFAVLFLDVDRFKVINDSMGHAYGDELLVQMAERLRGAVRATDVVSRCQTM